MKRTSKHTFTFLFICSVGTVVARPALSAVPADAAATPIPPPHPAYVAPVAPSQPVAAQPAPSLQLPPAQTTSGGRGLLIAGIITTVAGVAGAGAGVVLGMKANTLDDEAKKLGGVAGSDKSDAAKTYRTTGYACWGVGAAAFAAGGVLIVWGIVRLVSTTPESPPAPVAVSPMVGPGLGGAALSASF
jgi:hypothetical protein